MEANMTEDVQPDVVEEQIVIHEDELPEIEVAEQETEPLNISNIGAPDDDGGKHYNQIVQPEQE